MSQLPVFINVFNYIFILYVLLCLLLVLIFNLHFTSVINFYQCYIFYYKRVDKVLNTLLVFRFTKAKYGFKALTLVCPLTL